MINHLYFLIFLIVSVILTGCATMKTESEYAIKIPAEITNFHDITPNDNLLTIAPIIPLFGAMNFGRSTGFLGAMTGVNITNTHQRFGTLSAEGLYYFTFNADENSQTNEDENLYPFGKLPKISLKTTYDIPIIRLNNSPKKMAFILGTASIPGSTEVNYLFMESDVVRDRRINLRIGVTHQYMSSDLSAPNHIRVFQQVNTLKLGLLYSETVNTSFTANLNDKRFNPTYKAFKTYRQEIYFDIDLYLSGRILPVITADSFSNGAYVYSEKYPEDYLLTLKKTGVEFGYRRSFFISKHVIFIGSIAFGAGSSYLAKDQKPLFMKMRFQIGFGAVHKGK